MRQAERALHAEEPNPQQDSNEPAATEELRVDTLLKPETVGRSRRSSVARRQAHKVLFTSPLFLLYTVSSQAPGRHTARARTAVSGRRKAANRSVSMRASHGAMPAS